MMIRLILGALAGGLAGYGLHRLIGCPTGGCPLVGNPYSSILIWGVLGAFMATAH
jgi:hypothetical protein